MMAPMLVWIIFAVMTAAGLAAVLLPLCGREAVVLVLKRTSSDP